MLCLQTLSFTCQASLECLQRQQASQQSPEHSCEGPAEELASGAQWRKKQAAQGQRKEGSKRSEGVCWQKQGRQGELGCCNVVCDLSETSAKLTKLLVGELWSIQILRLPFCYQTVHFCLPDQRRRPGERIKEK